MANCTVTSGVNLTDSAGSQLIGLMANCGLFGLLVAQVFTYHTNFLNDHIAHKVLVQAVFALEIVQTILLSHDRYITFVLRFGDPLATRLIRTSWFTVPILSGIIGFIAQVFYAVRIYKISKFLGISVVILLLAVVQLAAGLADGALTHQWKYFYQMRSQKVLSLISTWLLSTVICDILIAVSMTSLLLRFRRDFHTPSFRISKLISLTVETGTVTASVAMMGGILFLARPGSQSFNVPADILPKLYANSLMRILNNRVKVGNGYSEPFLTTTPELTALSSSSGQDPESSQQPCAPGEQTSGDPSPEHVEKGTA